MHSVQLIPLLYKADPTSTSGVLLRIWLKQGKEKRQLARILEILEKARKRLSRQNSTKKCVNVREKRPEFYTKHINFRFTQLEEQAQ